MRRYASPQWLYKSNVAITAHATEDLPSSYFRNTLPYPFSLHWLAITGITNTAAEGDFALDGGIARTMRANLAFSSEGDINYIRALAATLMAPARANRYHRAGYAVGHALKFNQGRGALDQPAYPVIPADTGLEVSVRHPGLNDAWAEQGDPTSYDYVSALFNGFTLPGKAGMDRNPAHLAAVGPKSLTQTSAMQFDCADLQNDGKDDLHLVEMILNDVRDPIGGIFGQASLDLEWMINPTTGVPWMPEAEHMPLGNIAPFNDQQLTAATIAGGTGAWAYEFPRGTVLNPRQRLGIELRDISGEQQNVNISLFGYLEVS